MTDEHHHDESPQPEVGQHVRMPENFGHSLVVMAISTVVVEQFRDRRVSGNLPMLGLVVNGPVVDDIDAHANVIRPGTRPAAGMLIVGLDGAASLVASLYAAYASLGATSAFQAQVDQLRAHAAAEHLEPGRIDVSYVADAGPEPVLLETVDTDDLAPGMRVRLPSGEVGYVAGTHPGGFDLVPPWHGHHMFLAQFGYMMTRDTSVEKLDLSDARRVLTYTPAHCYYCDALMTTDVIPTCPGPEGQTPS